MNGGIVHGIGQKGKVMDYEDIQDISIQYMYIYDKDFVEKQVPKKDWYPILHLDKKKEYVVKEFMDPPFPMRLQGYTKKTYLLRELHGMKQTLQYHGIKYHDIIVGFVIMTPEGERCFTVQRKCTETITQHKLAEMTHSEFKQFVIDILSQLVKIQKMGLAHGDIKLDNIMKCKTYQLIDWENSRTLHYETLVKQRYLGLSPMYFQILYGSAWYPAFSVALLKYYQETGGTKEYANQMISYFSSLFQKYSPKEVFEKTKYSLDVGTLGFVLSGVPNLPKKYNIIIQNMYQMNAKEALRAFKGSTFKNRK